MSPLSPVPGWLTLPYFVLWASLMRALFVRARIAPPTCPRCGLGFERRQMGEPICSCSK